MTQWFRLKKEQWEQALATTTAQASGATALEPLAALVASEVFPVKILEDKNIQNNAEVHRDEGDLWQCLEGEPTFIVGGSLFDPQYRQFPDGTANKAELWASAITNGETITLHPGDWLWIPADVPHQHGCSGVARLAIIKIPVKK